MTANPFYSDKPIKGQAKIPPQQPEEFWEQTEKLRNIRDFARSRKVSPDAMLHAILAILSAYTDQKCDTGLGRPAAASYYTFIVAPSGAGKNRAIEAAQDYVSLVNDENVRCISTGSHQGLIQAYMTKKRDGNEQTKHGVLVTTDEGAQFVAPERGEDKHTGLRTALCQMYTGTQDPGQANASAETSRSLPGGNYTLGLIVGVQDKFAVRFMDQGAEQGLTQRIAWAGLIDANRMKGVSERVAPMSINRSLLRVATSKSITFDSEITKILLEDDDKRNDPFSADPGMTGGDALNAHMPLQLSKTALLLAILHDRTTVDIGMWKLAGQVVKTSHKVRNSFIQKAKLEATASRRERLEEKAYEQAVINGVTEASSSREFTAERSFENTLEALVGHTKKPLAKSCPKGGHTFSCAWRSLSGRKRGELAHLKDQLQVVFNDAVRPSTDGLQAMPAEPVQATVDAVASADASPPPVVIEEPPLPISAQDASEAMLEVLDSMEELVVGTRHRSVGSDEAFRRVDSKGVDKAEALARFRCRRAEYSRERCEGGSPEHKRWTTLIQAKFQAEIDEAVWTQFEREHADEIKSFQDELDRRNKLNQEKPVHGPQLPWQKGPYTDLSYGWDEGSDEYAILEAHEQGQRKQRVDLQEKFARIDERRRQWEEVA